ncbi:MAG: saccharopine dehydrogenase NADP-binding domain-containing protein [Chitinophagales bacterium]|nr:saccharopine dehydrogenase NADP-binding domain-containing protein [Chitinophagales bacterium]
MQTILVVGAGKTSVFLIDYLLTNSQRLSWRVLVADSSMEAIIDKTNHHPNSEAVVMDIADDAARAKLVSRADIVISLLPPSLHILLAQDCLALKKHLITSSYISEDMKALDAKVKEAGLMFMCEMGLDPGIDHMTANQIIHGIQKVAGAITSFKSFAGGLVSSESDTNPWHYKFSWNPRNVVLAGSNGAKYLSNGKVVDITYEELFAHPKRGAKIDGVSPLVYYPNRDSVSYMQQYDLPDVKTFMRATYRYSGYMRGWNVLVQLGLTDPNDTVTAKTYTDWVCNKNGFDKNRSLKEQVAAKMDLEPGESTMNMVAWLGIFEDKPIEQPATSSADILLNVLLQKWAMKPNDKDLVIMRHEVEYLHKGNKKTTLVSTMTAKGDNSKYSAMAKTVGLPMAILARLVLGNKIKPPVGVHIPNMPTVYKPVLAELAEHGIVFKEEID